MVGVVAANAIAKGDGGITSCTLSTLRPPSAGIDVVFISNIESVQSSTPLRTGAVPSNASDKKVRANPLLLLRFSS